MATGRVPTTANSPLTAKGDLFGYSTTQARVAVGSDGDTLVADSAATTGLRWSGATGQNPVINGAFDIWQRGTSIANPVSSNNYAADRWQMGRQGAAGLTVSRQVTGDTTNLPNIQYCARVQRDSGNTSTNVIQLAQSFETVNSIPFAGKTVTLSFYARAGANFSAASSSLGYGIGTGTGTDQSLLITYTGATYPIGTSATLTTTWQRFSATGTLSSSANEIGIYFSYNAVGTAGANDYFEVTGVQIDVGSVALPFRRAGGTIQGELAACQRYYWRDTAGDSYSPFAAGVSSSTTTAILVSPLPVTMRIAPSLSYSSLQLFDGGTATVTSFSSRSTTKTAGGDYTASGGGGGAGSAGGAAAYRTGGNGGNGSSSSISGSSVTYAGGGGGSGYEQTPGAGGSGGGGSAVVTGSGNPGTANRGGGGGAGSSGTGNGGNGGSGIVIVRYAA